MERPGEPMGRAEIEAALREIMGEYVHPPDRPILPDEHLVFDLQIEDDDASFEMIPEIHRRFAIEPPSYAWSSAATFADVVALVERYQRQPATREELARDRAELREAQHRVHTRVLAVLGTAAGLQLSGDLGVAFIPVVLVAFLASQVPGARRFRRARAAWKARRRQDSAPAG